MNITKVKLSDICIGKGNYGIPASAVPFSEDLYTYLRITDINDDGTLNLADKKSVNDPKAKNYILKENDIVFARTGNSTGRSYFYDSRDGELVYAGFLIKFSLDPQKVNPLFIKYYAISEAYRGWIASFNTGSTRGNINAQTYANMEIPLPSRSQQDLTVDILSSLDSKIRWNTQINHNLEEQAKAIFKSWFLDFSALDNPDFYSYEGVTCPVGWRVSYLADIADYLNGLAMQKYRPDEGDFGYPVLKIKELRQRMCDKDSERCSFHIKPEYIVHDGDVIFSWSGSLLVDFWCGGECGLNQHLFKVSSTKYDKWFYYSWTQYHLNEFIAIAADKATTMGHIKREHLQSATVLVPPADIYNEIGKLLGPIYEAITRNRIESKMLAQLRDSLLPKLMSGEIDVSEVEV